MYIVVDSALSRFYSIFSFEHMAISTYPSNMILQKIELYILIKIVIILLLWQIFIEQFTVKLFEYNYLKIFLLKW